MSYTKQTYKQPSARLVIIETESLIAGSGSGNENVGQGGGFTPTSTRRQESPWDFDPFNS